MKHFFTVALALWLAPLPGRSGDGNQPIHPNRPARVEIPARRPDQKFLVLTTAAFDIAKGKFKLERLTWNQYHKNRAGYYQDTNGEEMKMDDTYAGDALGEAMKRRGYVDTSGTVLRNNLNTLHLKLSVQAASVKEITYGSNGGDRGVVVTELTVTWEITDLYQQPKSERTLVANSGEVAFEKLSNTKQAIRKSLEAALLASFGQLVNEAEVKKLLQKEAPAPEAKQEVITLRKPTRPVADVEEALAATVTIKLNKGHGSGLLVSQDGYVLTNYHVVAGEKKVEVLLGDKRTFAATVVRTNQLMDLALLKTDLKTDNAFVLDETGTQDFRVGQDIFVIGTPTSVDLGQTLTKGIVSGKRALDGQDWIQTDAAVSFGNSGGPLITKEGKLLGVVNAKLVGRGIEKIAFAIPGRHITQFLSLQYGPAGPRPAPHEPRSVERGPIK